MSSALVRLAFLSFLSSYKQSTQNLRILSIRNFMLHLLGDGI